MTKPIDILTGGEHSRSIEAGVCTSCAQTTNEFEFRDELSLREFGISGYCQACQDQVFDPPEIRDELSRQKGAEEHDEAGDAEAFERPMSFATPHPVDAEGPEFNPMREATRRACAEHVKLLKTAPPCPVAAQCECDNHHGFCEVHD